MRWHSSERGSLWQLTRAHVPATEATSSCWHIGILAMLVPRGGLAAAQHRDLLFAEKQGLSDTGTTVLCGLTPRDLPRQKPVCRAQILLRCRVSLLKAVFDVALAHLVLEGVRAWNNLRDDVKLLTAPLSKKRGPLTAHPRVGKGQSSRKERKTEILGAAAPRWPRLSLPESTVSSEMNPELFKDP